jgi:hypothetical protein
MGNEPIYVISGKERRQVKKRLGELKRFVKMYWFYNDIEEVYGGGLSKKESLILLAEKQTEINELERELSKRL